VARTILVAVTLSSIVSALVATSVTYFFVSREGSTEQAKTERSDVDLQIDRDRPNEAATAQTNAAQVKKNTSGQIDVPHIELDELIKLYMFPSGVSYNVLGWDIGSEPGTPISWEHAGIKDCDHGTGACRTGTVVITVNGKPAYTVLKRTVEPGRWTVTLMGSRAGIDFVSIDCNCLSRELDAQLGKMATKSEGGLEASSLKTCGDYQVRYELSRVTTLGKKPAFVLEGNSCGSTGFCETSFALHFSKKEAENAMASSCEE